MLCRELTLAGRCENQVKLVPLCCRSWTCDHCFPKRLRDLRDIAKAGHPTKFITLTVNPKYWPDPYEATRRLVESWRLIRQQMKREGLAKSVEYLGVIELTKAGVPHLHLLVRMPYVDQEWLSEKMALYMRSPIVDISAVKSQRHVTRYLAKYCSKGPARVGTCKRFFRSRGWCDSAELRHKEKDPRWKWEVLDLHPADAVFAFEICDWHHSMSDANVAVFEARESSRWPSAARPPTWLLKRKQKCNSS